MAQLDRDTSTDDLTRPGLYSFYDNSINDNDNSIYDELSKNIAKNPVHPGTTSALLHRHTSLSTRLVRFVVSTVVLGALGVVFHQVGEHIHDNHILVPELASKPLNIGFDITHDLVLRTLGVDLPRSAAYAIEGVFFGSIVPLVDRYVFGVKQSKLLTIDSTSIVRAGVAFLGVAFAVRKIEWASSLQAAVAWLMLNPCLWLLLDSTISGFFTALTMASLAASSVALVDTGVPQMWWSNTDFIATMLWLGNFIFFGLIVFGNIGRYFWA